MVTELQTKTVVEVLECGCKIKRVADSDMIDILLCCAHTEQLARGRPVYLTRSGKKRDLHLEPHSDKEALYAS